MEKETFIRNLKTHKQGSMFFQDALPIFYTQIIKCLNAGLEQQETIYFIVSIHWSGLTHYFDEILQARVGSTFRELKEFEIQPEVTTKILKQSKSKFFTPKNGY